MATSKIPQPNACMMVETVRSIPTTVALGSHDGKVLTALTGQSLTADIPSGYSLSGHANIVINGQAGMYPIFDGGQMKQTTIDPFIYNVGSGTLPSGSVLQVRLYSLVVRT